MNKEKIASLRTLEAAIWEQDERTPRGSIWQHYGGDLYEVVGFGIDEPSGEVEIEYRALPTIVVFHRLASIWEQTLPDGRKRFERIS